MREESGGEKAASNPIKKNVCVCQEKMIIVRTRSSNYTNRKVHKFRNTSLGDDAFFLEHSL